MTEEKFDSYTIEPLGEDEWAVYGHGTYEESSVLAGQPSRVFINDYRTCAKAKEAWPQASVSESSTRIDIDMPDMAPSWFDPADAGEEW